MIAWAQTQGARAYQQDRAEWVADAGSGTPVLAILADGMGGYSGGERASTLAVEAARDAFASSAGASMRERLNNAVQRATDAVVAAAQADPTLAQMGSTLVLAAIEGDALYWASVGDSPLWLIRDGAMLRLNQNHSVAATLDDMVARGELSPDEAANDPRRSQLTSAIADGALRKIDNPEIPLRLSRADTIILASDGVETLSPPQLIASCENTTPEDAASTIIAAINALDAPGQDNATLVIWRPGVGAASLHAVGSRSGITMRDGKTLRRTLVGASLALVASAALVLSWGFGWISSPERAPARVAAVNESGASAQIPKSIAIVKHHIEEDAETSATRDAKQAAPRLAPPSQQAPAQHAPDEHDAQHGAED